MAKQKVTLEVIEADEPAGKKPRRSRKGSGPRPLWTGSISFGLVNIPVRMVNAVRNHDIRFHLLHEKDNARLNRPYICSVENKPVPRDEIKRGYEISKDHHVIIEDKEIESLSPKATHTIDLMYFVDPKEIDPIYFDVPYYLVPEERAAKAYRLLIEAMEQSGKAAISEVIMRNKEYIALIRPLDGVLCLDTMRFPDEVIFPKELPNRVPSVNVSDREVKAGQTLIDSLSSKFHPEKLRDDYREALKKMIDRKAKGHKIVTSGTEKPEEPTQVTDLMAALEKSLTQSKSRKKSA